MATPKAPPGGFKEGGWYEGQRYMGGKFLPAGQYEPGKTVSAEVNAQSAKTQGVTTQNFDSYLQKQGLPASNSSSINKALNSYGTDLYNAAQAPQTRVQTPEEVKAQLQPSTGLPPLLNRTDEFAKLRTEFGVADLEKSLTNIKDQIEAEFNNIRAQRGIEEGKPVAMNVIQGRISEEERVASQRIDNLGRQQSRITDELNTKYNVINQFMQFQGLDYNDAVQRYQDEFNMNLKVYDIIEGQKKTARSEFEYDQTAAKANLQIYANAITQGNMSYNQMSPDQKLMISKLEVQSGLPIGFIGSLNMSAKDRLISVNDKTGEALMVGENGQFNVVKTGMTPSGTGGTNSVSSTQKRNYTSSAMKILSDIDTNYRDIGGKLTKLDPEDANGDRMLSQAEANAALQKIIDEVGDVALGQQIFLEAFNQGGFKKWGK